MPRHIHPGPASISIHLPRPSSPTFSANTLSWESTQMLLWLAWMEGGRVVGSLLHTYPHSFVPLKSSWVSLVGRQGEGAAAGDRRPLTDSDNWQLALLPRGYPFGSRNSVKVNVGCSSREYCSFICFSRNIARPPLVSTQSEHGDWVGYLTPSFFGGPFHPWPDSGKLVLCCRTRNLRVRVTSPSSCRSGRARGDPEGFGGHFREVWQQEEEASGAH